MDVKSFTKLGPEFREQFSEDIQHDLTYNLREGYEAEEVRDTKYVFLYYRATVFTKLHFLNILTMIQISLSVCQWQTILVLPNSLAYWANL
jgi:hypothetical protein